MNTNFDHKAMRELRRIAGVTQVEAAVVARCSNGTIFNFEVGRAELTHGQIADLLALYQARLSVRLARIEFAVE